MTSRTVRIELQYPTTSPMAALLPVPPMREQAERRRTLLAVVGSFLALLVLVVLLGVQVGHSIGATR